MKRLIYVLMFFLLLSACGGKPPASPKVAVTQVEQSVSIQITHDPDSTATSAPPSPLKGMTVEESSASATPAPTQTPLVPSGNWQIRQDNADGLTPLYTARTGPLGDVNGQAWSPDGSRLAVAGSAGVLLLDASSFQMAAELPVVAPVSKFAFSADGRRLAAVGLTGVLQVWDTQEKKLLRYFPGVGQAVAISPDGSLVAGADDIPELDNAYNDLGTRIVIQIYRVDTGKLVTTLTGITPVSVWNYIYIETVGLFFSADGRTIQAANVFGDVRSWDIANGRLLATSINDHTRSRLSTGTCEAVGASGRSFALACNINYLDPPCSEDDPTCFPVAKTRFDVGLWESNQLKRTTNLIYTDPTGSGHFLFYDPVKRKAGLFDPFAPASHWPAPNGKTSVQAFSPDQAARWNEWFKSCPDCPRTLSLHPSGGKLSFAVGGRIVLLDLSQGEIIRQYDNPRQSLTTAALGVLDNQPILAAGYSDGSIAFIQPDDGAQLRAVNSTHTYVVSGLAFSGTDLVSVGKDGQVQLWPPGAVKPGRTLKTGYASTPLGGFYRFTYNLASDLILLDGSPGEGGLSDPVITAYGLHSGASQFTLPGTPNASAFSRDGRWLAVGASWTATIYVTNAGELLRSFELADSGQPVSGLALSPDGSLLAVVVNSSVVIVNVNTRQELARLQDDQFDPVLVEFDPAGCLLAVGGMQGQILLLDVKTAQVLARLSAHTGAISGLGFSQDGHFLWSVGIDRRAVVWGLPGALEQPSGAPLEQSCHLADPPATSTPTLTPVPATPTPTQTQATFTRELFLMEPAMSGGDVLQLQQRLYDLGYTGVGTPDGWFGPKTDEAVRLFQERNGLVVDGIVGRITWTRLFSPDAVRR